MDFNDYEKLKLLGSGSFGVVYAVKIKDKQYAMKELSTIDAMNEIENYSLLNSECIIKLYKYIHKSTITKMFLECMDGDIFDKQDIDVHLVLTHIGSAIQHIHELGYIHCDIYPKNILYTTHNNEDVFKLADLGSMCKIDDYKHYPNLCSPCYKPPEYHQSIVDIKYIPAFDIWGLAISILYSIKEYNIPKECTWITLVKYIILSSNNTKIDPERIIYYIRNNKYDNTLTGNIKVKPNIKHCELLMKMLNFNYTERINIKDIFKYLCPDDQEKAI